MLWMRGIGFDFFPQAAHIDGEGIVIYEISRIVPEFIQNVIPRNGPVCVADKKAEKTVFRTCQVQFPAVPYDAAVQKIDEKIS